MLLKVTTLALLTVNLLHAAPTPKVEKRLLSSLAPVASAINGVSIILENDVDSSKPKYSFLLLSQPRGYYDGMNSCLSMGDGMFIPLFALEPLPPPCFFWLSILTYVLST
jgi:acetylcholinesterase